jgi:crotonobetainyl-CoA:carnitine CoA-transferase CaiB-like acyl-CoA transferase
MKNRGELLAKLQDIFLTRSYDEWEKLLVENGVPVGAINNIAQVVNHPQVKARGSLVEINHPRVGKTRIVGPVAKLSETPATIRSMSPLLGEHTEQVLRDFLGLPAATIAELRELGVIAKR